MRQPVGRFRGHSAQCPGERGEETRGQEGGLGLCLWAGSGVRRRPQAGEGGTAAWRVGSTHRGPLHPGGQRGAGFLLFLSLTFKGWETHQAGAVFQGRVNTANKAISRLVHTAGPNAPRGIINELWGDGPVPRKPGGCAALQGPRLSPACLLHYAGCKPAPTPLDSSCLAGQPYPCSAALPRCVMLELKERHWGTQSIPHSTLTAAVAPSQSQGARPVVATGVSPCPPPPTDALSASPRPCWCLLQLPVLTSPLSVLGRVEGRTHRTSCLDTRPTVALVQVHYHLL